MKRFKDMLNEKTKGSAVLPLKGQVKGSTIGTNAEDAAKFFGDDVGAVIFTDLTGKLLLVYTAGSGKKQYDTHKKDGKVKLYHDQTGKTIAYVEPVGYMEVDGDGNISKISGGEVSDKITAYTYK